MQQKMAGRRLLSQEMVADLAGKAKARADWVERLSAARQWISSYQATAVEKTKEKTLQGTFLHRVFVDVLGYRDRGAGGQLWTLESEPRTEIDARFADGSAGFFTAQGKATKAVIELKDALADLDAKQLSRRDRLSPVEQAFLYLVRFEEARYAFVSNFRVLRLYAKKFGMTRYEEFDLERADTEEIARFLGVCAEEVLLGSDSEAPSQIDRLLSQRVVRAQQEITEEFYKQLADYRDRVVRYVYSHQPAWGPQTISYVQKFLDRVLFILFAEQVGLLPANILKQTIRQGLRSRARRPDRAWQELRYLFQDIDKGRPDFDPTINRYNGGLFAHDAHLDDEFWLPDELVDDLQIFERFDFRTEIDVNILGHVFENSLVDLEILKREISWEPHSVEEGVAAVDEQRKNLGIYYTPSWVTHYVVDQTLGRYLQGADTEVRLAVKILDPSCGSGAFLSEALSYLTGYSRSIARAAVQKGDANLFDETVGVTAVHHIHQIFGVDLLPEAVEISKLSLWLKSAMRSRPLADIETVVVGNTLSMADDSLGNTVVGKIAGEEGFEVVVGNPPWGAKLDYELDESLEMRSGQFDSYELFVERSLRDLCKQGGYFGFVIPDRILRPEGERLRRFLFDRFRVVAVLKLGEGVFPGVFRAAVVIIVQNVPPPPEGSYDGLIVTKGDRRQLEEEGSARLNRLIEQRGGSVTYKRVTKDPHYNIALAPERDLRIAEKMDADRVPWIGHDGIFGLHGRGEELGQDTFLVQCPGCFEWSVNPRRRAKRRGGGFEDKICPECGTSFSVADAIERKLVVLDAYDPDDPSQEPIYVGEHVNRYFVTEPVGLRVGIKDFRYKPEALYEPPKLLIRQTGVGIYATIDHTNARCLQSVYSYRLKDGDRVGLEYYLAQLCSRAMLFYYYILTNQVEWQSFPKLTHETLHQLPLKQPSLKDRYERERCEKVKALVQRKMSLAKAEQQEVPSDESLAVDFEIEKQVSAIYGLTPDDVARISDRLRHSQNIRIIRELYPDPEN